MDNRINHHLFVKSLNQRSKRVEISSCCCWQQINDTLGKAAASASRAHCTKMGTMGFGLTLEGLLFLWCSRQLPLGAHWMVNSCQGSWSLQRFRTWTWAVNPVGTFSLRVVFLSWRSSHLFSPKFSYSHERILELTPPTVLLVGDGQNECCVQLSLVLLILPGTLSLQLLQFDAEVACWEVFRLQADHIFSFSPLPCLSCQFWAERLHDHRCLCSLLFFIAWNIRSGIWIVALFFFCLFFLGFFLMCQSSCTSPQFIPQWALKCSELPITQVSCSEGRMTNVPCRMADSQPKLVRFQQAQPRQTLQPWGIQPYPSCTVFTGGLHSVINEILLHIIGRSTAQQNLLDNQMGQKGRNNQWNI